MLNINTWQITDFIKETNYQALKQEVDNLLFRNDEEGAFELYKQLASKKELIDNSVKGNLRDKYLGLFKLLKFISLPYLDNRLVLNIINDELAEILAYNQEELDTREKMRKKLIRIPLLERDVYKKQLVNVLEKSKQLITRTKPVIDGKEVEGSVSNWIKDYHKFTTEHQGDEKLIQAEYLYKNKNISKLNESEKNKIKLLLDLYARWKKSSLPLVNREELTLVEKNGHLYGVGDGKIIDFGSSTNTSSRQKQRDITGNLGAQERETGKVIGSETLKNLVSRPLSSQQDNIEYKINLLQNKFKSFLSHQLIKEALNKINKLNQSNDLGLPELRSHFYHAVNQKQTLSALVILFVLLRQNKFKSFFVDDERFVRFWSAYLRKHNLFKKEFDKDPGNAKDMAIFLKYIFEERLGLSKAEALMAGAVLSNLARQYKETEYQQLVYGDIETGEFKWNI